MDFLYSIDVSLFRFINETLSNPVGDVLWPLITDYDKLLPVRIVLVLVWFGLLVMGGRTGRTVALLLIPVLLCADTISSKIIKELVGRIRPCGVLEHVHLLVNCGTGKSFPSSHAVNNFAVATLFSLYYRRWMWAFAAWASLVALSRPAVGVHYPSDILAGALFGVLLALLLIASWRVLEKKLLPQGLTKESRNRE